MATTLTDVLASTLAVEEPSPLAPEPGELVVGIIAFVLILCNGIILGKPGDPPGEISFGIGYPIAIVDMARPPSDFPTPVGLPMTYLIAPDGRIAEDFIGPVTAQKIEAAIAAASPR